MPYLPPSSLISPRATGQGGFTLIELMVTLTVMGILMSVGIPAFQNFIAAQKVKTAAYEFTTSLVLARSEAIKRNGAITLAPDTAGVWGNGWTVKFGSTTLQQQQPLPGATFAKAPSASTIPASFIYGGNGRLTSATSTQYLQINNGTSYKCIKVDATGIPSTQSVACT